MKDRNDSKSNIEQYAKEDEAPQNKQNPLQKFQAVPVFLSLIHI